MTEREHFKALLLEWLIMWGADWVDYAQIGNTPMRFELGRLERNECVEPRYNGQKESTRIKLPYKVIEYKLTPKALQLLEE